MMRLRSATLAGAATRVFAVLLTAEMITRVSVQESRPVDASANAPDTLAFDSPRYWAAFDTLAELNGVRAEDFRVDPAALELAGGYADRLNLQRYLMAAPLRAPATLESLARSLTREIPGWSPAPAAPRLQELAGILGGEPGNLLRSDSPATAAAEVRKLQLWEVDALEPGEAAKLIDSAMALLYIGSGKRYQGRARETVLRESASLDPRIAPSISSLLAAAVQAAEDRDRILEQSELAQGGFLGGRSKATVRALLRQLGEAPAPSLEARLEDAEMVRRLDSVDLAALVAAALPLASAIDRVVNELPDPGARDFHLEWPTPRGRVAIGGTGANRYRGDYLLVLDLGGDDSYAGPGAASGDQPVSIVIDAGGSDCYAPADSVSMGPGGALLGYAAVCDLGEGRDEYTALRGGGGFGFLGVGWLVDGGGDDRYAMGSWSEGAAARGVGLLIDAGGNDHHDCRGQAVRRVQGFGGNRGVGALIDLGGDDEYLAGPFRDESPRPGEARLSGMVLGQGAAAGQLPGESGGVGLLIDGTGRDLYRADGRSQGAGAAAGLGALVDLEGDDSYFAAEQGGGWAQGIGLLLDAAGDDALESWSPWGGGPGMGVDLGLGVLADASGDDWYLMTGGMAGTSLKQGAGFWIDLSGLDDCVIGPATILAAAVSGGRVDPLCVLSPGVAVILALGADDAHGADLLDRLVESRREHGSPTFEPRRCLGGALIGNRAFPPLFQ